jgi:CheY-like chemotaxis protein
MTILVVDDLAVNRLLVRAMLEPMGHRIAEAASGAEAVMAAMRRPFDLILMDLQMPGMDGLEASRAIRSTAEPNRASPIVALSANVLAEQIADCHAAGMNDHLAKPIVPAALVAMLQKWAKPVADTPARVAA